MSNEKVTFFFPRFSTYYTIEELNLEDHQFFSSWKHLTLRTWIIQTYLRLKELNLNVHISESWPEEGTVVLLSDKESMGSLKANFSKINKQVNIITIRADEIQWRPFYTDIEIVQNGLFANDKDCFFIPHWPQPGIIKRDPNRKQEIKNIVFKGGKGSLDSIFYSERWDHEIKKRNLNFICNTEHTLTDWANYYEADLTLAVRPQFGDKYKRSDKPASKLVNSWFAKVPAILGEEYPFKELRKSNLDYLEVNTLKQAVEAIDLLIADRQLYQNMVDNGIMRSQEFSTNKIAEKWKNLLFEIVPKVREETKYKRSRMFRGNNRKIYHFITREQTSFEYKKRIGSIYRSFFYKPANKEESNVNN
ncbi:hypothetical protein LB467_16525 [Salegentibacter sp. JZCK2]|uniref:hypothetical protein n=1 Tax=Salegentibacter tibetensis TaxID=2873600 RepID=UPI001CCEDE5C|nr:hypothetical protein [Salegentibacter tibetensis]MBZ9731297.1 hypothetical protein [Salegentibacter tibetensis]